MANQKPKKMVKKSSTKPEAKKEATTTAASTASTSSATSAYTGKTPEKAAAKSVYASGPALKGFFARKYDKNENILTIFKTSRIWGALIGELVGTMFLMMLLLTLGVQPLYFLFATVGIYVAVVGLSGANLNPLVTVGMMATRRMSVIRGVLYILAQVLGAWVGLIIINTFRLASGTSVDLPMMNDLTLDNFALIATVELTGAIVIAFMFARAFKFARKSPLTFGMTVASGITLAIIVGIVITNNFFSLQDNNFIFNPAAALMYQILPTAADGLVELAKMTGLALAAYVAVPMVGGVLGFWLSDLSSGLAKCGFLCDDHACECEKKEA